MDNEFENLEPMKHAWDRMSVDYSEHTGLSPADAQYKIFASYFPQTDSKLQVMELGSGLGFSLDQIIPRMPHAEFSCLDISSEMLKGLKERLPHFASRIQTRTESYVTADLGTGKFDIILSSFTVHHLPKPTKQKLFQKIHSALNDRGIYLELDGVVSAARELKAQMEYEKYVIHRTGAELGEWNHDMCLTVSSEIELLTSAGFSEVTVPWRDRDDEDPDSGRAIFLARK